MTAIEWTDETWNPTRGCSRVSEGCRHCYAEQMAHRIVRMAKGKPSPYDGLVKIVRRTPDYGQGDEPVMEARWTGTVVFDPERLRQPLHWKKPRKIFVNSMSDLFHESLTNEQIAAVFGVMAACPQHTFQVLTKRAKRMREWFEWVEAAAAQDGVPVAAFCFAIAQPRGLGNQPREVVDSARAASWPLPNVWLGVSVEDQEAAEERIPDLLETPVAIRFLSCEPLLGAVSLSEYFDPCSVPCGEDPWPLLDWVIAGCESGHHARPCDVAWLRILRDQCAASGVAFFLKQAVEGCGCPPSHAHNQIEGCETCTCTWSEGDNRSLESGVSAGTGSKRKAGGVIGAPYLDGRQWLQFPRQQGAQA